MDTWAYDPFKGIEKIYLKRLASHRAGPADFKQNLTSAMTALGTAYRAGHQAELRTNFDRLAYVIQYAPIGIAAVRRLMDRVCLRPPPPQWSIFWDEPLHMVSVGAGPGTDLFGILTALSVPPCGLKFTRVDIHTKWKTYYDAFQKDFAMQVPGMANLLRGMTNSFRKVDLVKGKLADSACADDLKLADIIVLNRVLSTFHQNTSRTWGLVREIARIAPADSLLVVIDVSLPRPEFQEAVAMTEGACRIEKPTSECVARFIEIDMSHFSWNIPESIMDLERFGRRITRRGRFFGGVVWLRK